MARLICKTVFIIALLLLLVIMGMNNQQDVELRMKPLTAEVQKQPAAIMYFGFFAVGLFAGAVLMAGKRASKNKSE